MTKSPKKEKLCHPFQRVEEWAVTVPKQYNSPVWNKMYEVGEYSLDVENKPDGSFLGIGIYDGGCCWYWDDWKEAKHLIFKPFIAHAGAGDIGKLREWGFKVDESYLLWDTYLMEHIIDSTQRDYSLTTLTKKHLGHYYPDFKEICGKDKSFADFPPELIAQKNYCDTLFTFQLMEHQKARMY